MQICDLMKILMILVTCFLIFSFNTVLADSQTLIEKNCQPTIQQISAAQEIEKNQKPSLQNWQIIHGFPDRWHNRWENFAGVAWYKIDFHYECLTKNNPLPLTFAIEGITQAGRIWVNNDLIWQDLSTSEPRSRSQYMPRLFQLPTSTLKAGQNTLWLQVYGNIKQQSGVGHIALGDYPTVYADYKRWVLEKRTLPQLNMMVNIVVGIFYLLAWWVNRNEKGFILFALTSFLWTIYSAFFLYTDPISIFRYLDIDRLQHIVFCFYTVIGCLAAWYFADSPFPRIHRILLIFLLLAILGIGFAPESDIQTVMTIFFAFAIFIFLMKCLTFPLIAYKSKKPEIYLLMVLFLIYVPIAIHDAYFMLTEHGRPWTPYTAPFVTLALSTLLAIRMARSKRQIQQFNQTLQYNIEQAREELRLSLQDQHQLSLENARLQERMHLSHDLHDGLGGSIVRSILMVEQKHQLTTAQMLSILKMLRNDLRQIIDSGSSFASKIPDTPTEWAAPIRYRFIRLFEEMEIESCWSIQPSGTLSLQH